MRGSVHSVVRVALVAVLASGCSLITSSDCVSIGVPGIQLSVVDRRTNQTPIGTVVTVTDGEYRETLTRSGGVYVGAVERPGSYSVVVEAPGYAARGPRGSVLTQAAAREMLTPVGTGPFGVGPMLSFRGEGWYFNHSGSNWGFRANFEGHVRHGYGLVVMTNSDAGVRVIAELTERVSRVYGWDRVAEPLRR